MREFRGLRTIDGKWAKGYLIAGNWISEEEIDFSCHPEYIQQDCYEVDPETVGESTGLKDKNGVEIYEGDVVKRFTDPCKMYFLVGHIEYEGATTSFLCLVDGIAYNLSAYSDPRHGEDIEVIGNIHQNKELLK